MRRRSYEGDWVLVGPRHRSYDAQVRPDLRGGAFEREVLEYADARTAELMHRHGIEVIRCPAMRLPAARSRRRAITLGETPAEDNCPSRRP